MPGEGQRPRPFLKGERSRQLLPHSGLRRAPRSRCRRAAGPRALVLQPHSGKTGSEQLEDGRQTHA